MKACITALLLLSSLAFVRAAEHAAAHGPESTEGEKPTAPAAASAHAAEAPAAGAKHEEAEVESAPAQANPEEIASLLRIGHKKVDTKDYESAEIAFSQVLNARCPRDQKLEAIMGLARCYRKKGDLTKAAAVYEKTIKEFPDEAALPSLYLELGRTQRALGAYKQAISRFYSVINSTLKLSDTTADSYRQLARTAQFEIAETYFQSGDYDQATRFFARLKLLDLAPEDRARAYFKSAYSLILGNNHEKAVIALRGFLEQYPDDENVPEARFLLSDSLQKLGQTNESLAVTLDILRAEKERTQKDPKRWAYWQRKTGNSLANAFYERGDFNSALIIYENLAKISEEPIWRLPVTYQIGLCLERLQMYDRAGESYQTIVDIAKAPASDVAKRTELADLAEMAAWRLNQLSWYQDTQKQVAQLFPKQRSTEAPLSRSDSAPAHDAHGSAAKPSDSL